MKVVNPTNDINSFDVVPRIDFSTADLYIYDENTRVQESASATIVNNNGYYNITFDINDYPNINLYENGKYQIKLIDSEVIYRGKMIATTQIAQDYSLTYGRYE